MLALKGNQGNLFEDVQQIFEQAQSQNFQGIEHDFYQALDAGHGRLEKRRSWTMGQNELRGLRSEGFRSHFCGEVGKCRFFQQTKQKT